uniref:CAZy families GH3 protein n=1 Tax=uncultured Prevotella sp. TaxID=159272 RepID=A0A060CBY6_9BACT|nr:CAZy families GH3 protein [uncultured Prevotella sp.]
MDDTDRLTVNVDITNTGKVAGKEVVELYVASEKGKIIRPVIELKAFQKYCCNLAKHRQYHLN